MEKARLNPQYGSEPAWFPMSALFEDDVFGLELQPRCTSRRRVLAATMAAFVVATGAGWWSASSGDADREENQWPPSVPEVEVTMRDFDIQVDRPVPSGRVVFRVHNAGSVRHRVTLVALPEDMAPIDEQIRGDKRRTVNPVGAVNPRQPGGGGVFAVNLKQGLRYALICYEKDDDGVVHARRGGNAEFRAGGSSGG